MFNNILLSIDVVLIILIPIVSLLAAYRLGIINRKWVGKDEQPDKFHFVDLVLVVAADLQRYEVLMRDHAIPQNTQRVSRREYVISGRRFLYIIPEDPGARDGYYRETTAVLIDDSMFGSDASRIRRSAGSIMADRYISAQVGELIRAGIFIRPDYQQRDPQSKNKV